MSALKKIFIFFCAAISVTLTGILPTMLDIKQIHGNSMSPAFKKGDWIVIDTFYNEKSFFSRYKKIFCGDVLVFKSPRTDEMLIKRVAATEGDALVWIDSDTLQIGNETVKISPNKKYLFNDFTKVPKHAIFFLGDNQPESADSRDFGFVSTDRIEGKVLFGRCYENSFGKRKKTDKNQ